MILTRAQGAELKAAWEEIHRVSGKWYATQATYHLLPQWYRDVIQERAEEALARREGKEGGPR